tara:strand:+ start:4294 stop:5430 length:1137 start_codon:yes stop_codon:yes gene_type:complete
MPPHDSSDSWIDLSEIAKLVEQLMPDEKAKDSGQPPQLPPLRSPQAGSSLDDAPVSLVPDIPLAWEKVQSDGLSSFPSLDELEVPQKQEVAEDKIVESEAIFTEKAPVEEDLAPPSEEPDQPEAIVEPDSGEDEQIVEDEDDIPPPKVISMQSKVRADETLAHIRRLGRSSLPEAEDTEPFLKAESDPEAIEEEAEEIPVSENLPQPPSSVPEPPVEAVLPEEEEEVEQIVEGEPESAEDEEVAENLDQVLLLPQGSLRIRLQAYGDWVHQVTECTRFQITDGQGYSLMEDEKQQEASFVGSALQLMKVLENVGPKVGGEGASSGVYLPMGSEQWLCVLGCETRYGPVCLSMVTKAPLSAAAADELTGTLKRTLEAVG